MKIELKDMKLSKVEIIKPELDKMFNTCMYQIKKFHLKYIID